MSGRPSARRPARLRALALGLALLVLVLDQLAKAWAVAHLPEGLVQPLLPGLLRLQRVSNSGAAFSLLTGAPGFLALISLLVSAAVVVWLVLHPPRLLRQALALGFLLGGAAGNGLDRWRLGFVVDYLEFVPIRFPIFNLADVAINLAVACFALDLMLPPHRHDGTGDG